MLLRNALLIISSTFCQKCLDLFRWFNRQGTNQRTNIHSFQNHFLLFGFFSGSVISRTTMYNENFGGQILGSNFGGQINSDLLLVTSPKTGYFSICLSNKRHINIFDVSDSYLHWLKYTWPKSTNYSTPKNSKNLIILYFDRSKLVIDGTK